MARLYGNCSDFADLGAAYAGSVLQGAGFMAEVERIEETANFGVCDF